MNLYVGNVSSRTREKDLRYKFERYGHLLRCELLNGFAFVEFDDDRDGRDAIRALDGYELDGRRLQVEQARSRGDRDGYRGGGDRDRDRRDDRGGSSRSGGGSGTGIRGGAVRGKRDHCILVKGLSERTGWQQLKDWSRQGSGGYIEYTDVWDEGGHRYGVVKFDNSKDFKTALRKLDNTKLDGEYVRVYEDQGGAVTSISRSRSPRRSRSRDRSRSRKRSPSRSRSTGRKASSKSKDRSRSPPREKRAERRSSSPGRRSKSRSRSRSPKKTRDASPVVEKASSPARDD